MQKGSNSCRSSDKNHLSQKPPFRREIRHKERRGGAIQQGEQLVQPHTSLPTNSNVDTSHLVPGISEQSSQFSY